MQESFAEYLQKQVRLKSRSGDGHMWSAKFWCGKTSKAACRFPSSQNLAESGVKFAKDACVEARGMRESDFMNELYKRYKQVLLAPDTFVGQDEESEMAVPPDRPSPDRIDDLQLVRASLVIQETALVLANADG